MVFSEERSCCGNRPSCGRGLRAAVDHRSGPYSDEGHRDDADLLATMSCCYLGSCIYGPFASLLDL